MTSPPVSPSLPPLAGFSTTAFGGVFNIKWRGGEVKGVHP